MFDVLDQLDGRFVAIFNVVSRIAVITVAVQQALVGRIQPQLRHVFIVHDDQPLVAMLHERHIGLNQPRLAEVVALAGPGVERADEVVQFP